MHNNPWKLQLFFSLAALGLPSVSCTTWREYYDSHKNNYKIFNSAWIMYSVRYLSFFLPCILFYNCTVVLCGFSLSFCLWSERVFKEAVLRNKWIKLNFSSCQKRILLNPVCFFFSFFPQGFICGFSIATGAAARLLSGYDSYGNICGQKNVKVEGIVNSGLDLTQKKWVCDSVA